MPSAQIMGGFPPTLSLVATTGPAGTPLTAGTPTFLTWTAPNDGNMHRIIVFTAMQVSSADTGGAVGLGWTQPSGNSQAPASQIFAANLGTGPQWNSQLRLVAPGSTVTIQQSSALTVGAAIFYGEIWAS